jgi:hypothetical protein
MDFAQTGQVDLEINKDVYTDYRCLEFTDRSGAGRPEHACIAPPERQKARVDKIAEEIISEARTQNVSPRSRALADRVVARWIARSANVSVAGDVERNGVIGIDFDSRGRSGSNTWCIVVPQDNTGTAMVNQARCS